MKKLVLIVTCALGFFGSAQANDVHPIKYFESDFDISAIAFSLENTDTNILNTQNIRAAAAQGITYYQILGVYSTQHGSYEYPAETSHTTTYDHGGRIEVAVAQYGYGNSNGATLNGASPRARS